MSRVIQGRALVFGDDVNTDELQPSRFFSLDSSVRAGGVLGNRDAAEVENAILIAGWNFGVGSSRESVVRGLVEAGVRAAVARNISRIFLRNAANRGLPVYSELEDVAGIESGDPVELDTDTCELRCPARSIVYRFAPLDPYLQAVLDAGGLMQYLEAQK